MAHYPADTFQEATEIAIEASNQLHGVINGDANAEVTVEDGSKIPSVRKAMVDSLYFLPPVAWAQGEYEDTYNQLREFVDGDVRTWWFAKGATVSTPVLMTTNPATDVNWTLWSAVTLNAATYKTQKRLAAEAGLNMVGSFLLGGTVTTTNDVVFYETDGKYYGWGGTLPKTVPAGATPATSGGVGAGAWVDRTDLTLRGELAGSEGALRVGFSGLKPTVAESILNIEKRNVYVTDYAGYDTDIGLTITNIITVKLATEAAVRIIIPYGTYPQLTSVVQTIPMYKSVEIFFHSGAVINVNNDISAFSFVGDATTNFHLSGYGRLNANFGVNSSTATALKVSGFRFPKSLCIDGAMRIGTTTHDVNWKTGFHLVDCDTPIVFGLHLQEASTTPFSTAIKLEAVDQQTTDLRFICVTTGGHRYWLEAYNHRTGAGLEGMQFIDCSFVGGYALIKNMVAPATYAPPQVWFKGCHINSIPGNEMPIVVVGYNSIRLEDMDVYTYGSGLIACDGCTSIDISNTDVYWMDGANGNTVFLTSSVGACGGLTIEGLRDHTSSAVGAVVVMNTSSIYGVDIVSAKKDAVDKPWINNIGNANWDTVRVSRDLAFGFSNGDSKLLTTQMASTTGALNISNSVGDVIELSTAGNINALSGKHHREITLVCNVIGQSFTHNENLLLSGGVSATSTVAGAAITFRYVGSGVYREISRTPAF